MIVSAMSYRLIYIASAFSEKDRAHQLAVELTELGHHVISNWHEYSETSDADADAATLNQRGFENHVLLTLANTMIVLDGGNPCETWTELGVYLYDFAYRPRHLINDKQMPIIVGRWSKEPISLNRCARVQTLDEALVKLSHLDSDQRG